jgi:hypothetical protein
LPIWKKNKEETPVFKYRSHVLLMIFLSFFSSCCFTATRTIENEPHSAYLNFNAEIKDAKIFLDGEFQDFTQKYTEEQYVLEIPPGRHSLKVTDSDGNVIFDQDIYIDRGQTRTINLSAGGSR